MLVVNLSFDAIGCHNRWHLIVTTGYVIVTSLQFTAITAVDQVRQASSSHKYFRKPLERSQDHYGDVIMTKITSQITSLTVVYSIGYSDADQRKHQSSASLAFVWGIHRDRWIPCTKGQLRGKCFHLMTSSCLRPVSQSAYELNILAKSDAAAWQIMIRSGHNFIHATTAELGF